MARAALSADAVKLAALERELRRLKAIVKRLRRAYGDLVVHGRGYEGQERDEQELPDDISFDDDEMGIDPEEDY